MNASIDGLNILKSQWMNHVHIEATHAVSMFSFDELKSVNNNILCTSSHKTVEFILNWGALYVKTYIKPVDKTLQDIRSILLIQINSFRSRHGIFKNINNIISDIKSACISQKIFFQPKLVWVNYKDDAYELYTIVNALLSICPTESSVERTFSIQNSIHTKKRNRLDQKTVESELILQWNLNAMHDNFKPQMNECSELSDEI